MSNELAPLPYDGETDSEYLERVVVYLTRRHRRRMGDKTAEHVRAAIRRLSEHH